MERKAGRIVGIADPKDEIGKVFFTNSKVTLGMGLFFAIAIGFGLHLIFDLAIVSFGAATLTMFLIGILPLFTAQQKERYFDDLLVHIDNKLTDEDIDLDRHDIKQFINVKELRVDDDWVIKGEHERGEFIIFLAKKAKKMARKPKVKRFVIQEDQGETLIPSTETQEELEVIVENIDGQNEEKNLPATVHETLEKNNAKRIKTA